METPDVNQIAKDSEKLKLEMIYNNNFNVSDKKLMQQWFKYFDQQLNSARSLQVKHDLINAFKIMSDIGKIMPPFNVGPHNSAQRVIKGPKQLSEFSSRFHAEDFRQTMEGYIKRQRTKNNPKMQVKTVVTNRKSVEEERDPLTGIPTRVTTISTILEVSSNDPNAAVLNAQNLDERNKDVEKNRLTARQKFTPLHPEMKKQRLQNIKLVEKDICQLLSEQIPESVQIFAQWISILSHKLNREADYNNRLNALIALRKCAQNNIIAAPFDIMPKRGVINIREFLKQLENTKIEDNIEDAIRRVKKEESVIPHDMLETATSVTRIEGRVPSHINQRMQIIPLKQKIYDIKKSTEYSCEYIDKSLADVYKKWSNLFERALSSGYTELCERLEFEKECDKCLNKGTLPDFMYDEEPPELRKFNMSIARSFLRKLKEFNGSDMSKFPEIVDFQSMTQQERKEMMLKKRAEHIKKKTGAIPKTIGLTSTCKEGELELSNPLVKNDILKAVTNNMVKALDAIVHEDLENLMHIPTIVDQVKNVVKVSPHKKMNRIETYDDIIAYHRQYKLTPNQNPSADFIPFTLEELPIESNVQSRVVAENYTPLSSIIINANEDLLNESAPDLDQSIYEEVFDENMLISTPERFGIEPATSSPLIKMDNQSMIALQYPREYELIPESFKSFLGRMVKKELVHWPVYLQDFGRQLKWRSDRQTEKLIYFSP